VVSDKAHAGLRRLTLQVSHGVPSPSACGLEWGWPGWAILLFHSIGVVGATANVLLHQTQHFGASSSTLSRHGLIIRGATHESKAKFRGKSLEHPGASVRLSVRVHNHSSVHWATCTMDLSPLIRLAACRLGESGWCFFIHRPISLLHCAWHARQKLNEKKGLRAGFDD
jgi:hypothetical protein